MTEPAQPSEPMAPEPMEPSPAPEPMAPTPAPAAPAGWAAPAAPAPAMAMTGARPQGLTIAAVLAGIYGGLLILASLFLILGMSILGGAAGAANGSGALGGAIAGIGFVAAIFVILIALAYIATAVGNWRGRPWSWTLGMIVWIVTLVFGLLGLSGGVNVFNLVLQVVFPIIAIYFLWQPDVKRALGRS